MISTLGGFLPSLPPPVGQPQAHQAQVPALFAASAVPPTTAAREHMLSFKEYNQTLELDEIEEWERRFPG